jgi:hypothetical protein
LTARWKPLKLTSITPLIGKLRPVAPANSSLTVSVVSFAPPKSYAWLIFSPSPWPGIVTDRSRGIDSTATRPRLGSRRISRIVSERGWKPTFASVERLERRSEPSTSSVRGPPGLTSSTLTCSAGSGFGAPGSTGGCTILCTCNSTAAATAPPEQTTMTSDATAALASTDSPTRGGR